jgi:hypothetical protein
MGRPLIISLILTALFGATGCGFMDHLLGVPEAAPPLGESILSDAATLVDKGLVDGYTPPAGQCIPSETDQPCDDTGDALPVQVDQLAGIWVEAAYGSSAVHIDPDGSIRQVDLAQMIAGHPLPAGIPRTLYNVGQVTVSPYGDVTVEASLSVPGFAAAGTGTGYLDSSLNAIFGMAIQGQMTVLGQTTELYIPGVVWFRWDPETGEFPFMDKLYWLEAAQTTAQ